MNTTMNRRRNYFINKDFQIRFIQRFLVSTTVWAVAAAAFFAYFAKRRLQDALYSSHLTIKSTAELLGPSTLLAHAIALVLFAALLAYAIYALWKKLSVPLYMLKKDLVRIASGDLVNDVTLREEDEFQKLAAEIDEMRKELRRKLVRIKEKHADVSTAVSGLDRVLLQGQPVSNQAESIKAAAARLLARLAVAGPHRGREQHGLQHVAGAVRGPDVVTLPVQHGDHHERAARTLECLDGRAGRAFERTGQVESRARWFVLFLARPSHAGRPFFAESNS